MIYRHYKGGTYGFLGEALIVSDFEEGAAVICTGRLSEAAEIQGDDGKVAIPTGVIVFQGREGLAVCIPAGLSKAYVAGEKAAIYVALKPGGEVWVRPWAMWQDEVAGVPRFAPLVPRLRLV